MSATEAAMRDLTLLGNDEGDKLAGLVFELGAQLHIERVRRMALETALVRAGIVTPEEIEALAADDAFLAATRAALDASMRKLMRIVSEHGDATAPLRAEAPS